MRVRLVKKLLIRHVENFQAGNIRQFLENWIKFTSDPEILDMVKGLHIDFDCLEHRDPVGLPYNLSVQESLVIDEEVEKLLAKGVISPCVASADQHVSPVFTCPKKDGARRMILNLKRLNVDICYRHFKMDSLFSALQLVTPGCFMTSVDLKDAYYSVPIAEQDKIFLRFWWRGELYQYNAMPNGLALAPRKFTKLLKPVFSKLRAQGYASTAFIDDSLQLSESYTKALKNVLATTELMLSLGFAVHPDKSVLSPTQRITYLGMIIDSVLMTVQLTEERIAGILNLCNKLVQATTCTIRDLARIIGKIISSFPAVKYGPLYFRHLEETKKAALKINRGDFDAITGIPSEAREELEWWINNVQSATKSIIVSDPDIVIQSDASLKGWGCVCNNIKSGGSWLPGETLQHINYLELKAAFFALKCYEHLILGKHVRLLMDNSTAVCCINKMGTSHSVELNHLTFLIWTWCRSRDVWISASHIPGVSNVVADRESRKINLDAEWMLNPDLFNEACVYLDFYPIIDLFASRVNHQCERYISYRPDPEAEAINAFDFPWDNRFYAFPPFCVILRVLSKVRRERKEGLVIVPDWPTQVWWPLLQSLLVRPPFHLPQGTSLLQLPSNPEAVHRLCPKLRLLACRISGKD